MADKKITQLTTASSISSDDLLLVVDAPNTVPVSKKITVKSLFGSIPSNTSISANLTVSGNRLRAAANVVVTKTTSVNNFIVTKKADPSSNNATTATVSGLTPVSPSTNLPVGTMWFSNTYLYIATDATTIRRVALSRFS
jgi:hypothetical protein